MPIVSEVEVGLRLQPALRVIATTGTNGKTTTTALIGHLLRGLGHDAVDIGNIGTPVSEIGLRPVAPAWASLEMSSFQLHDTPGLLPDVGVLTTLSPDHLDRYAGVEEYYADKRLLFLNATSSSKWVVTADNDDVSTMMQGIAGQLHRFSTQRTDVDAWFDRTTGCCTCSARHWSARDQLALAGDHNVANALAALLAVMVADGSTSHPRHAHNSPRPSPRSRRSRIVSSRWPIVRACSGSTTPRPRTWRPRKSRIAGMTRPTIVLLGGRHKGQPYTSLVPELARTAKAVLAFGEAGPLITADLAAPLHDRCRWSTWATRRSLRSMSRARALSVPVMWCCCLQLAPATTCSITTRSAAARSRDWRQGATT